MWRAYVQSLWPEPSWDGKAFSSIRTQLLRGKPLYISPQAYLIWGILSKPCCILCGIHVYIYIYILYWAILVYSESVCIHILSWQTQGIEESARKVTQITALWQTGKGDEVHSSQGSNGRCDGNSEITCRVSSSAPFSLSFFVTDQQGCFQYKKALAFRRLQHFSIAFLDR